MMTTFADNFWGEKNNGFFVVYTNMKNGQTSSKDLIDFLKESCAVEENYSKLLAKLAKLTSNTAVVGTFAPFWAVLRSLIEKLSSLHMQLVHTWSDLIKDMVRYSDEQHKRHKSMKETEQGTLEVVQAIQQTTVALHKAREIYHTRCIERERLRRENASPKELEKAEIKYKKAFDEYKNLIDKYESVKSVFEKKMTDSCQHFQELEEEHICQMKDFIDTYAKSWENEHALLGQVHREFKLNCDELTVQKLISSFMEAKRTGTEKPGPIEFVEPDLSSMSTPGPRPMSPDPATNDKRDSLTDKQKQDSSGSPSPVLSDQPGPLSRSVKLRVSRTWFLKNKNKKKEKKLKKKKDKDDKDSESVDAESQGDGPEAEVDEEGYRIRPDNPMDNNGDKNSWYSSDSDTDSDGEESRRKIKVEIRPLSPTNDRSTTGTIEDIRASFEGLRLSPSAMRKRSQTPIDKKMKRSQSESDTLEKYCTLGRNRTRGKPSQDLLNLDFFGTSSSASTPTGTSYTLPSPISPKTEINWNLASAGPQPSRSSFPASSPSNLTDLLSPSNESGSSIGGRSSTNPTPTSQLNSPTTSASISFPAALPARPPSRSRAILSQPLKVQNGPASLVRSDSSGPVTFNTTSMPVGSSRGPSPLTIGMSDTIPLAIAFTETVNAFFKGHDATKCVVRMSGNLMMSFPAGVVKVFTDNPSPPSLSFRIRSNSHLENLIPNSSLLSKDSSQNTGVDMLTFTFDMSSLIEHLRHQGEQNKTASYFNVDILKYQIKAKTGVDSTPLPLVVYWKCEENTTDFRMDYRYNASAMSVAATLKNVTVAVGLDAEVLKMHSLPSANWDADTKRAMWKLNDISDVSEQESQGCIRAKFDIKDGPAKPTTTALQFAAEGATLSGVDFELVGTGYRMSLIKKRFATGKYFADPEPTVSYV